MKYLLFTVALLLSTRALADVTLVKENYAPKWAVIKFLPNESDEGDALLFMTKYCAPMTFEVGNREYAQEGYSNGLDTMLAFRRRGPVYLNRTRSVVYMGFFCKHKEEGEQK